MRFNQANEWKTKSETESLCVLRILLSCYFASFFCMVVVFLFLLYCFMDTLRLMDRQLLIPRYAYNYLYQQYHSAQWEKKQKQKNDENGKSHYEHKWHTFVGILAMCILPLILPILVDIHFFHFFLCLSINCIDRKVIDGNVYASSSQFTRRLIIYAVFFSFLTQVSSSGFLWMEILFFWKKKLCF